MDSGRGLGYHASSALQRMLAWTAYANSVRMGLSLVLERMPVLDAHPAGLVVKADVVTAQTASNKIVLAKIVSAAQCTSIWPKILADAQPVRTGSNHLAKIYPGQNTLCKPAMERLCAAQAIFL